MSSPDETATTQAPAPAKSRVGQNIAAVVILLFMAVALWTFWPRAPQRPPNPMEGRLEVVSRDRIVGWAWDRKQPNVPVQVEISDGVNPPVVITADKFRADLQKAGKGDGRHCFSYDVGKRFQFARTYTVHAKVVGSSAELQNSPQQLVVGVKWVDEPATMPTKTATRKTK